MATWIVTRRDTWANDAWETQGTTQREPSEELVKEFCQHGHVPAREDGFFSERGVEFRFLPVGGGEPIVFTARYDLTIQRSDAEAEDVARLRDLDEPEEVE